MGRSFSTLVIAALACAACACSRAPKHPNVVLIVVDTLRADRLGCYGYARPTSPVIDALAREGTVFEECVAQAPWTLPSMTSLFSGRYLMRHREWPEPGHVVLAECFQRAGYATIGASANMLLDEPRGFDRGFDHYDASAMGADAESKPIDELCAAVLPVVERSLAQDREKPLFLFLQPFDPHYPYQAHAQFDATLPTDGAEPVKPAGWQRQALALAGASGPADDPDWSAHLAELQFGRGLYDQEVRAVDAGLARLFARLRELHVLDDAVVAIVSDHGEGLWEHVNHGSAETLHELVQPSGLGPVGYFLHSHAHHVYEEAVRTPFVLWGRGVPRGKRVADPVENVDLYATLCGLAGVAPPLLADGRPQLEGRDLRACFASSPPAPREHTFSYAYQTATVRERSTGLKLVVPTCSCTDVAKFGVRSELFDLTADPDERVNLWDTRPADVARLLRVLEDKIVNHPAPTTWGLKVPQQDAQLDGLGYKGVEGTPPEPGVLCGDAAAGR